MDCNLRSPLHWDWENLITFNSSRTEAHRKLPPTGWESEKGGGIESVFPCFSGFDGGSSVSGSNFWNSALSKNSESTSVNSSSSDVKTPKFTSENSEGIAGDFSSNLEFSQTKVSPTLEVSVCSAEPLLDLKLGKRAYLEDVCAGNNDEGSTVSMNFIPSVSPVKKTKSTCQNMQTPRCQVEGCKLDLSSSKDYHRKHRVCESHSKCPRVVVGGLERRFCQQCSRFHCLSEFDEKKRSCRKRLSHHNARRRKPQPGVFPLNPPRIYDGEQHSSLVWNRFTRPIRAEQNFAWEGTRAIKPTQIAGFALNYPKAGGIEEKLRPSSSRPLNVITPYQSNCGYLPGKANIISFQVPSKGNLDTAGIEEFSVSSDFDETQDFLRAPSLLSTTSWGSCEPKHVSVDRHTNNPEPPVHLISQAFPASFI